MNLHGPRANYERASLVVSLMAGLPQQAPASSLLGYVASGDRAPDLEPVLLFLRAQGTGFICGALQILDATCERSCGAHPSSIAPLARGALLSMSKIVAVLSPLALDVAQIRPARELIHDEWINTFHSNERDAAPEWDDQAREGVVRSLNNVRRSIGKGAIEVRVPRAPNDLLVSEGRWVKNAERMGIDVIRQMDPGLVPDEGAMSRAWFTGSAVTHGGMRMRPLPNGLGMNARTLNVMESLDLLAQAHRMMAAAWVLWSFAITDRPPDAIRWATDLRLDK